MFNIKFSELLNYLDLFEQYDLKTNKKEDSITNNSHNDNKLLSQFFKLDYTYLSFMDSNEVSGDIGLSDDNVYLLKTNTGKTKVTIQEYIKYLDIFNPEISHSPFEYVINNI